MAEIADGVGEILGLSVRERREIRRASLLHDIGKLGVSNLILDKPGPLTGEERKEIKKHVEYTRRILERVASFRELADLASSHHERLDGLGYHRELRAEALSPSARLLPVADIFEALTANRPYRAAAPAEKALAIMRPAVGTALCRRSFEALEAFVPRYHPSRLPYPPGSPPT